MSQDMFALDAVKECKFLIPMQLHVQLHRHRVLTGQAISATVSEALRDHLDRVLPADD